MSLRLQLKPVRQGEGSFSGIAIGASWHCHPKTSRATQVCHPQPFSSLRSKEGQSCSCSKAPWCIGCSFGGWFFSLFYLKSLCCVSSIIPAWQTRGIDLPLLLPQEPGASSRDKGQGRHRSLGRGIWGSKFRTGPTELPLARQSRGDSAAGGGSVGAFPRQKV